MSLGTLLCHPDKKKSLIKSKKKSCISKFRTVAYTANPEALKPTKWERRVSPSVFSCTLIVLNHILASDLFTAYIIIFVAQRDTDAVSHEVFYFSSFMGIPSYCSHGLRPIYEDHQDITLQQFLCIQDTFKLFVKLNLTWLVSTLSVQRIQCHPFCRMFTLLVIYIHMWSEMFIKQFNCTLG